MHNVGQNNPNEVRQRPNIPVIRNQQDLPDPQMLARAGQLPARAGQLSEGELKATCLASLCIIMTGLANLSYATDPAEICSGISLTANLRGPAGLVITGAGLYHFLPSASTLINNRGNPLLPIPGRQEPTEGQYKALTMLGCATMLYGVAALSAGFENSVECPESSFPMLPMSIGAMANFVGLLIVFYGVNGLFFSNRQ